MTINKLLKRALNKGLIIERIHILWEAVKPANHC